MTALSPPARLPKLSPPILAVTALSSGCSPSGSSGLRAASWLAPLMRGSEPFAWAVAEVGREPWREAARDLPSIGGSTLLSPSAIVRASCRRRRSRNAAVHGVHLCARPSSSLKIQ